MANKKTNPRKKPLTHADIKRIKNETMNEAIKNAFAIFFTVLWDKEHCDMESMKRVWDEVNELSDSISAGYVTTSDLLNTLKQEYNIYFGG